MTLVMLNAIQVKKNDQLNSTNIYARPEYIIFFISLIFPEGAKHPSTVSAYHNNIIAATGELFMAKTKHFIKAQDYLPCRQLSHDLQASCDTYLIIGSDNYSCYLFKTYSHHTVPRHAREWLELCLIGRLPEMKVS